MKNSFRHIFNLWILLFTLSECNAQLEAHLTNGEGWLKGNYVEMAINHRGVYGAFNFNRPASFHDNREYNENDLFGFIANPQADGWMDYDGDFFTTGNPEESFGIRIDGLNYNNFNTFQNVQEIEGEITSTNVISSGCFDDIAQISWEGSIDGLAIKRLYSVTENGLFIQMLTYIRNQSPDVKHDVYFMHNVDPDNNASLSGSYETDMHIISQANTNPNNLSLVTASQASLNIPEDMDGSYVSFYSKDPKARVSYGGFENRNASDIWNGNFVTIAQGSTAQSIDKAISISFKIGDLQPSESTKFTYYYILKEIDETFVPFIVNVIPENPTLCQVNNGKITFSGLEPNEIYTLNYQFNGTVIPNQSFTSDINGEFELTNLSEGRYSDFFISFNGCSNTIDTQIDLVDPQLPDFTITKSDITNCETVNGQIIISNLTPVESYLLTYNYDGEDIGPIISTTTNEGDLILNGLEEGVYSNFTLEQNNCVNSSTEQLQINSPTNQSSQVDTSPCLFIPNNTYEIILSISGDFLYSIDNGPFQTSNVFINISSGLHHFLIMDVNGCLIAEYDKFFVNYMPFFSPNNDTKNDYWQIVGAHYLINPKIYIFNRYGKLLKQLNPYSIGWDGTFNGYKLPSNDYWFTIYFEDVDGNQQQLTSHFTLKL